MTESKHHNTPSNRDGLPPKFAVGWRVDAEGRSTLGVKPAKPADSAAEPGAEPGKDLTTRQWVGMALSIGGWAVSFVPAALAMNLISTIVPCGEWEAGYKTGAAVCMSSDDTTYVAFLAAFIVCAMLAPPALGLAITRQKAWLQLTALVLWIPFILGLLWLWAMAASGM